MKYQANIDKTSIEVETDGSNLVSINGVKKSFELTKLSERFYHFNFDGKVYRVEALKTDEGFSLKINGELLSIEVKDELQVLLDKIGGSVKKKVSSGDVKAPMPGLVIKVQVAQGDTVKKGQALLILEAMKMQNEIKSPVDGVVKEIKVSQKEAVEKYQLLMKIE